MCGTCAFVYSYYLTTKREGSRCCLFCCLCPSYFNIKKKIPLTHHHHQPFSSLFLFFFDHYSNHISKTGSRTHVHHAERENGETVIFLERERERERERVEILDILSSNKQHTHIRKEGSKTKEKI